MYPTWWWARSSTKRVWTPGPIGAIQITDRFSLVEIPADIADSIIETLRATTIKGKRVPVRRDRELASKN